jgi:hypothetical protein
MSPYIYLPTVLLMEPYLKRRQSCPGQSFYGVIICSVIPLIDFTGTGKRKHLVQKLP